LITKPDFSKYDQIEKQISQKLQSISAAKHQLANAIRDYNAVSNIKPDGNCPECNVELIIVGKNIHKCDDSEKEATLKELAKTINNLENQISKEQEIQELVQKIKIKKQDEFADYYRAQSSISEY